MTEIYEPQEDSYLFKEYLEEILPQEDENVHLLDMGTGSTILAQTGKEQGIENITTADINPDAIKLAQEKGFKAIQTNLFQNIEDSFDIILFNAPYLPQDPNEPQDSQTITTGGKQGDEIPTEFIEQALNHLNPNGKILLLISSLTPMKNINKYNPKIVKEKQLPFFEKIIILEITDEKRE
ncbi:MAG: release factor glutamine methyltransferase [Patescibacteria group bacterium]|jgi:release factor glutamine methyltransferase